MQLAPAARAELADLLVGSLEIEPTDGIQAAWTKEALRRRDEIRSGKVKTIPGDEVLAEVRRKLNR